MKRLLLMIFLITLIVVPFSTINAINLDEEGPQSLARLMPGSTEIYAATRIGSDFIAELDAITTALYDKLPPSLMLEQPYTLDRTFREMFAEEGQDWDTFISLLGSYAAVALEPVNGFSSGEDPLAVVVLEITDQAGAEQYFLDLVEDPDEVPQRQMEGDTILYVSEEDNIKLMFTPDHLIFTNNLDYTTNVDPPLSSSSDYTTALNMLPADHYNMLAYVSEATVEAAFSEGDMGDLQEMGINPADAGALAIGLTILSGNTFTIDVGVQTVSTPGSTVNLDFLSAMPGTTDAFIVSSDLTGVYNNTVEAIRAAAEANGEEDPTEQIPLMFNITGLDLEEDVLSWTTGSYGVFLGADFMVLLDEMMATGTISELDFDAGLVIEATDTVLAQNTATELGDFFSSMLASEEDVTVSQEEINGTAVTSIMVEAPLDPDMPPLELEFVLTATDDFFFLGTRSAFDAVMSGNTLASNADFGKSTQYFLDNPSSVWYMNSDGVVVSTAIPLALLGPAIGNVFENVLEELGEDPGTSSDDGDVAPMSGDEALVEAMNTYDEILSSMTITTAVDADGVVRIRATMSVNP